MNEGIQQSKGYPYGITSIITIIMTLLQAGWPQPTHTESVVLES